MSVSSPSANLSYSSTTRIKIMATRKDMGYLLFWYIFLLPFVASQQRGSNSSLTSPEPPNQHEILGTPAPTNSTENILFTTKAKSSSTVSAEAPEDVTHTRATQNPNPDDSTTAGGGTGSNPVVTRLDTASDFQSTPSVLTTSPGTSPTLPTSEGIFTETKQPSGQPSSSLGPTETSHEPASTAITSTNGPPSIPEIKHTTGFLSSTSQYVSPNDPFSSTSTVGLISSNEPTSTTDPIFTTESTSTIGPTNESISTMGRSSESTYTTGPVSTSETVSTTAIFTTADTTPSNSSLGVLFPRIPKRNNLLPAFTTTTSTKKASPDKVPGGGGVLPCTPKRKEGLVSQCLIAIASLAGLATIFMVSTIVLCAKVSSSKHMYNVRRAEQGTEMVCISALLSDSHVPLRKSRIHQTNRELLGGGDLDSDEDTGDDLTLNSFFQDSERNV